MWKMAWWLAWALILASVALTLEGLRPLAILCAATAVLLLWFRDRARERQAAS